jgi:hypothetical protein
MGLISFYKDSDCDHAGRRLEDILSFDDRQLEDVHDYIQWLFPLPERSAFQPHVPSLTAEDIGAFKSTPAMQARLKESFTRILSFYGLKDDGEKIAPAENFAARTEEWLTPRNHNFLRITRILRSLTLLGLESEANRFFDALENLHKQPELKLIIGNSYSFWKQQVAPLPRPADSKPGMPHP